MFEKLNYYIFGETITVLFSLILLYNVLNSFSPYEKKHRLFLYALLSCLFSSLADVISVFCTTNFTVVNPAVTMAVQSFFYTMLIMTPLCLAGYALELAFAGKKTIAHYLSMIMYACYLILLMINAGTGLIFKVDQVLGYQKGPLKNITYIVAFLYMALIEITLFPRRKRLAKRMCFTIMLYPVIGVSVLIVQFFYPKVLLTGASSLAALLICYLTIQSDMLDYDMVTGLMSDHKLEKHIQLRNTEGILFILSIENLEIYRNTLAFTNYNELLLTIGKKFQKTFSNAYYTNGRFAGIVSDEQTAKEKYEELKSFFEELYFQGPVKITVPVEFFGVAVAFEKGEKNYSVIKSIIENLLLKAKINGKKSIQFCDESVLAELAKQEKIYEILKRELTLESNKFCVYYQPIYSVHDRKFLYMEALSRLTDDEMGPVSPVDFVQVAESKGLIEQLGNIAFEKICKFISDNRGVVNAVSINFSVYQMTNPNLVHHVLNTIAKYGLNTSNIIMEITESIFIENFQLVSKNMKELAEAGIKFYLDDFGNGYSNLANVVNLPFSTVKMDRSLVLAMEESEKNLNLFSNLVSTFKGSGLNVLVEGVETEAQSTMVIDAGVDYIQGFLYSRPLNEEACLKMLKSL